MEQVADLICVGVIAGAPGTEWDPKYSSSITPWKMAHGGWLGKFLGMKRHLTPYDRDGPDTKHLRTVYSLT